jgi:integrase
MDDKIRSTALVPIESGELVPLDLLAAEAEDLAEKAQASTTRAAYAWWWARFEAWCAARGLQAMPAQMGTIVLWVTEISQYGTGPRTVMRGRKEAKKPVTEPGKPLSRSSIQQAVAALQSKHRDAGHGSAIDRKHPALAKLLKAINRSKPAVVRKAEALTVVDMLELLPTINVEMSRGARDASLITLAFGAALRRSELVALDWQEPGDGAGFVSVKPEGILVTLLRSKASQDKPVEVAVSRADLPEACRALEHWANVAKLQPGEPIMRSVTNGHIISDERLQAASVSRIIKDLVADLAIHRSKGKLTRKEGKAIAAVYSGHSTRRGYASSAAAAGIDVLTMAKQTRHKSLSVLQEYVDAVDRWDEGSGLRGIKGGKNKEAA